MIHEIANHYGIKISSRVCGGHDLLQPVYNGQDIASYWLRCQYDSEGENIIARQNVQLSPHDMLHEIAHWVAAEPEQRDLPEYGLGVVAFNTYHMSTKIPQVVDKIAGDIQEQVCWLLCIHWGRKYNIPVDLSEDKFYKGKYCNNWDEYEKLKAMEMRQSKYGKYFGEAHHKFYQLLKEGLP